MHVCVHATCMCKKNCHSGIVHTEPLFIPTAFLRTYLDNCTDVLRKQGLYNIGQLFFVTRKLGLVVPLQASIMESRLVYH